MRKTGNTPLTLVASGVAPACSPNTPSFLLFVFSFYFLHVISQIPTFMSKETETKTLCSETAPRGGGAWRWTG